MTQLGWIGTGVMGCPMALNLLNKGEEVRLYNRNPAKLGPLLAAGGQACASPAEVALLSQVVFIMVTGPQALAQVLEQISSEVKPGQCIVNMSTVSLPACQEAEAWAKRHKAVFVDAPVSGTKRPAELGQLVVLAGGDPPVLQRLEPLFLKLAKRMLVCGPVGAGTRMKLMINNLLAGMLQAQAESLHLGQSLGLEIPAMLECIAEGAANAPLFQVKGKAMAAGDYEKQFSVDLLRKDLGLILDQAQALGIRLPQAQCNAQVLEQAQAHGWGDLDMSVVYRVLQEEK